MTQAQLTDPSGLTDFTDRTQHPRAPLSALELSRTDAVADYFRHRGSEPNYDEIAAMVPPFKYVNANFRFYPLVLGEKEGSAKLRLVADASQLHLGIRRERDTDRQHGCGIDSPYHWFGPDFRIIFRTGKEFTLPNATPTWREGYLPVAEYAWIHDGIRYTLDIFGAVLPATTECLCGWVRVGMERLAAETHGQWAMQLLGDAPLSLDTGYLVQQENGAVRAGLSPEWAFDEERQLLTWQLPAGEQRAHATLVVADQAIEGTLLEWPSSSPRWAIDEEKTRWDAGMWLADWASADAWQRRLQAYLTDWRQTFATAAQVSVPEPRVQQAQLGVRAGAFVIANHDQLPYSVHNPYERSYTDECGSAALTLACWGHVTEARRYLEHLAFYTQRGVTTHDLGIRLHLFCRYHALTANDDFLTRNLPRMRRWCDWLINDLRDEQHGLGAPNKHCGDLEHQVYSLSANCLAWRGLRDFGLLTGDDRLLQRAARYREDIRRAAEATIDMSADPPFLPMALYGDEPTPEVLTGTTLSSYWCLMAPYALYGNALGDDHPGTQAMIDTFRRRGGLCGGLVRWTPQDDYHTMTILRECGIDDLYGGKLIHVFARRDNADDLVLALYGKLALGLTPDTYVSGEGCSLAPSHIFDPQGSDGRSMYLPPNSTSQLLFALILRACLVFDMDSADDGRYNLLRLAFATPRRWLEDGKSIVVEQMPTAFGPVSYRITSRLAAGHIDAKVTLPSRIHPASCALRIRAPEGYTMQHVTANDSVILPFDPATETIDLSKMAGTVSLRVVY